MAGANERRGFYTACALFLGLISAVSQVVLTRELMTLFSGHELVFAVVLGAWLFGIAAGSSLTCFKGQGVAGALVLLSVFLLPLTVLGARSFKGLLGIPLGSAADPGVIAGVSLALLFPLTFVLGAAFAALARQTDARDIYAREALGFVAGGVVMTFVFLFPLPKSLASWVEQKAWPGYHLVASDQTRYGSLVVVERVGQKSFFENGRLVFSTGDLVAAEEVHAGLLTHPSPRTVFLMGGGFSQSGAEALKYPLERLDYAELDPGLVRLEHQEIPWKDDPRLHVLTGDPRVLLAHGRQAYDVIVMNTGDPLTLSAGRLFSREFLFVARSHLASGGIFAVTISGAENDVNQQGRVYARSVMATLSSVFEYVQVIPGERMTFLASRVPYELSAGSLARRLKERGISTQFMRDYYLNERMSPVRMAGVAAWLKGKDGTADVSTDARPRTVLRALVFATTRTGTGFAKFMAELERWQGWLWLMVPAIFVLGFGARKKFLVVTGAAIAGFTQMTFQVAAIFLVQVVFGYAYAVIGLMTAGFMLGAVFGVPLAHYVKATTGAWLQVVLAGVFMALLSGWPFGVFFFPVVAGIAGGIQFAGYLAMAGTKNSGKIYAADVMGAGCGALCTGLFLVPLWGMSTTMLLVAALNLVMGILLWVQPKSVSAER